MKLKVLLLAGLLLVTAAAYADVFQTYALTWSGASFGNNATATGLMTLDLTTLPNPSGFEDDITSDITSLSVTVSGAKTAMEPSPRPICFSRSGGLAELHWTC